MKVPANSITRVEVVMADGTRLVVAGSMVGYINTHNEIMDTGVTPGGFVTREATGRTTVTVVAHVNRPKGDTLEWATEPLDVEAVPS